MTQAVKSKRLFARRKQRVRTAIKKHGRVRLSVFRSGKHIYAQLIDDGRGVTLASASSLDKDVKGKVKSGATLEAAKSVGEAIAKKAQAAKVKEVVFDRAGYLFHGRVKALADAARESGLAF
ncbi:MAG: 50S ribosomal protein L18 [Pseudomonadota bacterium]|nr:50S ribosomal protein L18 [Pseudomonadota bacterium]MDE3037871.1 50S ribosomal protein L18 [Pseudomonadota bacterium]